MKIAVIAPTEIPSRRANSVQVMKMAQALTVLGHETRVLAPQVKGGEAPVPWPTLARHYGLTQAFEVNWRVARPMWRRYDYGLKALRWASQWGADVIYTRLPQAAFLAGQFHRPVIFEVHDLPTSRMGSWLIQAFLDGGGPRRLVVITRALADDLNRYFGAPMEPPFTIIAPDGVDLERFEGLPGSVEARRSLQPVLGDRLPVERFTAGYTGHLYAGRGSEMLVELAARLPQMTFLVVGGDPADVARLEEQGSSRGLSNLLLTGFVPNAELPLMQAACEVLLMPYQERVAASSGGDIARYLSPMKLFEYLACGRAIVSSDLPVLRETLNENNAILLPPSDVTAWQAALQALQVDLERRAALATRAAHDAYQYTWNWRARRILSGWGKTGILQGASRDNYRPG